MGDGVSEQVWLAHRVWLARHQARERQREQWTIRDLRVAVGRALAYWDDDETLFAYAAERAFRDMADVGWQRRRRRAERFDVDWLTAILEKTEAPSARRVVVRPQRHADPEADVA